MNAKQLEYVRQAIPRMREHVSGFMNDAFPPDDLELVNAIERSVLKSAEVDARFPVALASVLLMESVQRLPANRQ